MKFSFEKLPNKRKELNKPDFEIKRYHLESGINVELKVKKLTPSNQELLNNEEAVFVLPGWGTDVDSPVVENFSQGYADVFKQKTFTISSRAEQHVSENKNVQIMEEESKAIANYIANSGKKVITLTGYSQGGNKAMNVVAILQKNHPEINISGLVLVGSAGLYSQDELDIVKNFNKDALINTPKKILEGSNKIADIKNAVSSVVTIFQNTMREIIKSKTDYLTRFKRELSEIGTENIHMSEIESPIILIAGSDDLIAQREKFMPQDKEDALRNELENATTSDIREHYLRENCFSNSPYIRMVSPSKNGTHSLPYFRPKAVANVSAGLLKRYYEDKKNISDRL
jgi:hypothetical protein